MTTTYIVPRECEKDRRALGANLTKVGSVGVFQTPGRSHHLCVAEEEAREMGGGPSNCGGAVLVLPGISSLMVS